jgi:hypothetical protein
MDNVAATIVSQYAASPSLAQLIAGLNECVDPAANFDAFYDLVWNVQTAVGWGLDVWGRIVDVSRTVQVVTGEVTLGFEESGALSAVPFGSGTFYAGAGVTDGYALSDEAYRTLIYAKALSNICNGSIPAINQILLYLFPGRGNCYCTDGLNMTMTYTFDFALTAVEVAIVSQSGVLAKPAGVVATIVS